MKYTTSFISSIKDIDSSQWQALARDAGPFLQYPFLAAMEACHCVGPETGWQPHHLSVCDGDKLVAVMPGYLKEDSYGEYVFDHGWAHAYDQYGLNYYPKWISAVPFTPVTGNRLLISPEYEERDILQVAVPALKALSEQGCSSSHILFSPYHNSKSWYEQGFARRYSVQFQWYNYGYQTFSDFTAALTSRKRKALRKSREKLEQAGVSLTRITGDALTSEHIEFFIRCYQQTYLKRSGHTGYLTPAFFRQIFSTMASNVLLVIAAQEQEPVASALFFYDDNGLYGRYWGAMKEVDGLHFETCYNQGIAFAVERGIPLFNPGTQGEHKILRGFEPTWCVSLHKLYDADFQHAVEQFLQQETPQIARYLQQAATVLPFNEAMQTTLKTTSTAVVTPDAATTKKRNDNEV